MREDIKATHHYDHQKIANALGIDLNKVRQMGTNYGEIFTPYKVSGDKGVLLYDHSGFLVWEQIVQMQQRGLTPKTIKKHLRKTFKSEDQNQQNTENLVDPLRAHFESRGEGSKKVVGNEVVPRDLHNEMRGDLKERIEEHKKEIKYLRDQIKDLHDQTKLLPSPAEFQRSRDRAIQARTDAHVLIRELRDLQKKQYGMFAGGERREDKRRTEEIISQLDELNLKH